MSKIYDPAMHTVEHVLNQTMVRMFGCDRCYSSHLNKGKSKCDYIFPRALEQNDVLALECRVNEVLRKNLPVRETLLPRREAAQKVALDRLPSHVEDMENAVIRLVEIGDYDICPCIGEHVKNTAETGYFRIVSHDFIPDGDTESSRHEKAGSASPCSLGSVERPGRLRLRFRLENPISS